MCCLCEFMSSLELIHCRHIGYLKTEGQKKINWLYLQYLSRCPKNQIRLYVPVHTRLLFFIGQQNCSDNLVYDPGRQLVVYYDLRPPGATVILTCSYANICGSRLVWFCYDNTATNLRSGRREARGRNGNKDDQAQRLYPGGYTQAEWSKAYQTRFMNRMT